MRYINIYKRMVAQSLKQQLEYRADLVIGIFSFITVQAVGLLSIRLIYNYIPNLMGWEFAEVLLIYGLFQIPRGIDHLFTDNIWMIPHNIRRGTFDKYLIRPVNSLFYVMFERLQLEAIGELLIGVGILSYALPQLSIDFTLVTFLGLTIYIIMGTLIYTSIKLLTATTSFWLKDSVPLMVTVYDISNFVQRPVSIYPLAVQALLTYVLPFAFTAYLPAAFLLNKEGQDTLFIQGVLVTIVFLTLSINVWKLGIKKYESSGS